MCVIRSSWLEENDGDILLSDKTTHGHIQNEGDPLSYFPFHCTTYEIIHTKPLQIRRKCTESSSS
jgi:hypothetical protein